MNIQRVFRISQRIQIQVTRQHRTLQTINRERIAFRINKHPQFIKNHMSMYQLREDGFITKMLKSLPFLGINKTKLKAVAYLHFEAIADHINYNEFFDELDLADTFYTWFAITELHLWMVSARAMAEGEEGRLIRNNILEALWADVFIRVKKLGVAASPAETREKIVELSEQLQATYIAYDEGLQAEDVVLAGALWRRLYQQGEVDLEHLDLLVQYIRKNMRMLESLNSHEFYDPVNIKWKPLAR